MQFNSDGLNPKIINSLLQIFHTTPVNQHNASQNRDLEYSNPRKLVQQSEEPIKTERVMEELTLHKQCKY